MGRSCGTYGKDEKFIESYKIKWIIKKLECGLEPSDSG
jgi:hypothetical protein